jgi:3-phenylpropionate/trans-cinnamate dioxygenase ferredoxin subunit
VDIARQFRAVEVPAAKVQEDQPYQLKLAGQNAIAVYRVGEAYYAADDVCTHEFAYLSEGYCEDGIIECPLHQARFDVKSGMPLGPPASTCLGTYRTELVGGMVRVFVPVELFADAEQGP